MQGAEKQINKIKNTNAVWSCYQEEPVEFRGHRLYDPGAFDGEPIFGKITWKITGPYHPPENAKEKAAVDKMQKMILSLKARSKKRS